MHALKYLQYSSYNNNNLLIISPGVDPRGAQEPCDPTLPQLPLLAEDQPIL